MYVLLIGMYICIRSTARLQKACRSAVTVTCYKVTNCRLYRGPSLYYAYVKVCKHFRNQARSVTVVMPSMSRMFSFILTPLKKIQSALGWPGLIKIRTVGSLGAAQVRVKLQKVRVRDRVGSRETRWSVSLGSNCLIDSILASA